MTFVQIISFRTDQGDQLGALDQEWFATTRGRNTVLDQRLFLDRNDPRHHLVLVEFADHASAMANSELPETGEFAGRLTELADGPVEYLDLEPFSDEDVGAASRPVCARAARLGRGRRRLRRGLRADRALAPRGHAHAWPRRRSAPGSSPRPRAVTSSAGTSSTTENGFAVDYAYRTHGETSYLSVGLVLAIVGGRAGLPATVTCGGSWDADAEARILGDAAGASA